MVQAWNTDFWMVDINQSDGSVAASAVLWGQGWGLRGVSLSPPLLSQSRQRTPGRLLAQGHPRVVKTVPKLSPLVLNSASL